MENGGRVRANLETNLGNPLLAVTFDGMQPGLKSTAGDGATDVILQNACPARAKGSPEPCAVELTAIQRGDVRAAEGMIEPGSSFSFRVSCPESLTDDAGDAIGTTRQTPTHFGIAASPCNAF